MARGEQKSRLAKSVRVVKLPHAQDLPLPAYQSAGAAGLDLVAAVPGNAPIKLKKGARALVPTGLVLEIPMGYEAQVRPRSGLALKHGVTVLNSPGTIDSDYRGEVQVILVNLGDAPFVVQRGERIAQMVIAPVSQIALKAATTARPTVRGAGGFGSTGVAAKPAKSAKAVPVKGSKRAKAAKATKAVKAKTATRAASKAGAKRIVAVAFPRRALRSSVTGVTRGRRR